MSHALSKTVDIKIGGLVRQRRLNALLEQPKKRELVAGTSFSGEIYQREFEGEI
jgi:hypothetical protein